MFNADEQPLAASFARSKEGVVHLVPNFQYLKQNIRFNYVISKFIVPKSKKYQVRNKQNSLFNLKAILIKKTLWNCVEKLYNHHKQKTRILYIETLDIRGEATNMGYEINYNMHGGIIIQGRKGMQ